MLGRWHFSFVFFTEHKVTLESDGLSLILVFYELCNPEQVTYAKAQLLLLSVGFRKE